MLSYPWGKSKPFLQVVDFRQHIKTGREVFFGVLVCFFYNHNELRRNHL